MKTIFIITSNLVVLACGGNSGDRADARGGPNQQDTGPAPDTGLSPDTGAGSDSGTETGFGDTTGGDTGSEGCDPQEVARHQVENARLDRVWTDRYALSTDSTHCHTP